MYVGFLKFQFRRRSSTSQDCVNVVQTDLTKTIIDIQVQTEYCVRTYLLHENHTSIYHISSIQVIAMKFDITYFISLSKHQFVSE